MKTTLLSLSVFVIIFISGLNIKSTSSGGADINLNNLMSQSIAQAESDYSTSCYLQWSINSGGYYNKVRCYLCSYMQVSWYSDMHRCYM